ncbi:MAG TPA: molybdenum cofactor guanylyltransferase [Acidimicrobiia bacterium]|nr:molybdenum cofactor guanylyltransferase [Acidimicrobiia bacterium]
MTTPTGVLLTGGASRRLGTDKALLVRTGETLASRATRVLRAVCPHAVEVGVGHTTLPHTREEPAGGGPLAALLAGVDATGAEVALLLAVDLPNVDVPLLRLLADWPGAATVVPVAGGRVQPVCARYGSDAIARARLELARGERSLRAVLDAPDVELVDESVWSSVAPLDAFADVDVAADVARLGLEPPR